MKYFLSLIFATFALTSVGQETVDSPSHSEMEEAQEVQFYTDWDAALSRARAENKPLFIDFYTDWCVWCKVQDTSTFKDASVAAYINSNLVPVKVNAEKEGSDLALRFRPMGYPTVVVYDPNSQTPREFRIVGYNSDTEDYLMSLDENFTSGWSNLGFNPLGESPEFPDFFVARYGGDRVAYPQGEELSTWLHEHGSLTDEVAWAVILRGYYFMTDEMMNRVAENIPYYRQTYGADNTSTLVEGMVTSKVRKAETEDEFNTALEWGTPLMDEDFNPAYLQVYWYGEKEMWSEYIQVLAELEETEDLDASYLNGRLWTLVEKECEDEESCNTAAEMMAAYVQSDDTDPNYVDTFAWLLYKAGRHEEAKVQAERAIAMAGEMESAQELLDLLN